MAIAADVIPGPAVAAAAGTACELRDANPLDLSLAAGGPLATRTIGETEARGTIWVSAGAAKGDVDPDGVAKGDAATAASSTSTIVLSAAPEDGAAAVVGGSAVARTGESDGAAATRVGTTAKAN